MSPKRSLLIVIGLGICLALIGCRSNPEPDASTSMSSTPLAQLEPSATSHADLVTAPPVPQTESATNTAVPSIAPLSTNTPVPTPLPIPTSVVPLEPEGPWLLFLASKLQIQGGWWRQLFAVNADGSGLTELVDENILTFDAQPVNSIENGFKVAYVTRTDWGIVDPTLKIISLPGGEVKTIALLTDQTGADPLVPADYVSTAIREGGLAWSPDGRWLAFVGAMEGGSVDVYTYDTFSGAITRLTDGPTHACRLSWSPGGDYVLHQGFDMVGMGGVQISGMWAAQADGAGTMPLLEPLQTYTYIGYETWLSSTELLFASETFDDKSIIRVVNVESGASHQVVLEEEFFDAAYAPEHNIWMLTHPDATSSESYFTLLKNGEQTDIPDYNIEYVTWIPTSGVFLGRTTYGEVYTISLEGQVSKLPIEPNWQFFLAPYVNVSPDESLWAWFRYDFYGSGSELWIGEPLQQPTLIHATDFNMSHSSWIHDITWSPDSQRMLMLGSDGLCIAERPSFEVVLVSDSVFADSWDGWEAEWIP